MISVTFANSSSQYVHGSITSSAATVSATAVFDVFGVQRTGTGSFTAGVVRKIYGSGNEDGLSSFFLQRQQQPVKKPIRPGVPGGATIGPKPPKYEYPQWPIWDSSHGINWGYGNWCGLGRGAGVPMDELDGCCMSHDIGLGTGWDAFWNAGQFARELCACAKKANCNGIARCEGAKKDIVAMFCGVF